MNIHFTKQGFLAALFTGVVISLSNSVRDFVPVFTITSFWLIASFSVFPQPMNWASIVFRFVGITTFLRTELATKFNCRLENIKLFSAFDTIGFYPINPKRVAASFAVYRESLIHASSRAISRFTSLIEKTLDSISLSARLANFLYIATRYFLRKIFTLIRAIMLFTVTQSHRKPLEFFSTIFTTNYDHVFIPTKYLFASRASAKQRGKIILAENCLLAQANQLIDSIMETSE